MISATVPPSKAVASPPRSLKYQHPDHVEGEQDGNDPEGDPFESQEPL